MLAYEDASLLKHYYCTMYLQKCSMYFSAQLLPLDMIFLTLSRKPGKNLVIVLSFVYIFYDLSLSTRLNKLLRFKLNQITRKRSGRTRLTMPTRKPWLNQAYHASEVGDFNQAHQETLVKPGLPSFWGGNFKPDSPENLGSTRLTRLLRWKISTRPTRKAW